MPNSIDLVVPWNRGSDMYDRKQHKREMREWIRSFASYEYVAEKYSELPIEAQTTLTQYMANMSTTEKQLFKKIADGADEKFSKLVSDMFGDNE